MKRQYRKIQKLNWLWIYGLVGALGISGMSGCANGSGSGITNVVVGTGSGEPTAYIGSSLPFSAQLSSADTIADLIALLTPATGGEVVLNTRLTSQNLEGIVQAKVEDQIELPADIRPGDYVFSLVMTDKAGARQSVDNPIRLMIDTSSPLVLDLEIGINPAGNDLHLAAQVTAPNKLAKITVFIHGEEWEKEYEFEGTSVNGKIEYHFHEHAHVDAAPAGTYEVTVTAADQQGRKSSATGNFTKN